MAVDERGGTTSGAGWGLIEDGKLERNSTAVLDQASVTAWRKAHPKPKKPRKKRSKEEGSAEGKEGGEGGGKKRKASTPPPPSQVLPLEIAGFRLDRSDALKIAAAIHDPSLPSTVSIIVHGDHQDDSALYNLPPIATVLEIVKSKNGCRRCDVIVDQARPKAYVKLMSQNMR